MNESKKPIVRSWLTDPLSDDVARSIQHLASHDDVCRLAIMPDIHLSSEVCVGLVLATRQLIYPSAVGSDIGCGMLAIALDADASLLKDERAAAMILADLERTVPTLKHASSAMLHDWPEALAQRPLSEPTLDKHNARDAHWQLGTLGRGNHFIEFQADDENQLWLMIHSGSRGMGQIITRHHLSKLRGSTKHLLLSLDATTDIGQAYLHDLDWAIEYASANRLAMLRSIEGLFAQRFQVPLMPESLIHGNHNHVRYESHFGENVLVHRKGALSAADGELGVIPGSMGTASYHVTGRGHCESLTSSSHGAGRRMSRSDASRRIRAKQFEREMAGIWYDHRRMNRLRDESPSAYKNIGDVMRAQRELTRIHRQLRPLLSYKGC